jgi:signal transduction histidine kinase
MAHMNRRVAMGELAASIAHELNQPLGAIYSNADAAHLMIGAVPPNLDEVAEILVDIKRDDKRASEVVARIRTMLRKSDVAAEEVDLNEAIAETINLLAFAASTHGVTVRTELEPDLPLVHADRVQIQQVIVNLMLNGMEAMREAREERQRLVIRSSRANEKEAEVSISDSGVGIPSEILPRIFDSFVSSKASGMGLGLSISRTIIEAHGGRIQAENLSAGGATFHFTVPFVHY